ncbi:MAG: ATP-binding protein [Terracidiphilus sp.]
MAYERNARRERRSVVRRVWLYCFLLTLPALIAVAFLVYLRAVSLAPAVLLDAALLLYLFLVAAALIESIVRPLQTLSNVVSSLREGDYSFRARGASSPDAFGELAFEINALASLLQKQRVRSLEATALLARVLEVMSAPLFAFDRNNRLQLVNNAGARLLGIPGARCTGRTAAELGLDALLAAPDQTVHSFAGRPARWLLRKAVFREEGEPNTLLLLADVSLSLREEEQSAWKKLIRVLGHEISNSLAPIKSIAGSLRTRIERLPAIEEDARDFHRGLEVIENRADALHRFVQSYRKLAQLPPPNLRPVHVASLLERVVLLEQRLAVELTPGPPVDLLADPDQLEQATINLLANAVDSALANGARPVEVSWRTEPGSLWIEITDRGQGIANAENLFVPFYTTKPTGSGVGLVLAQQIARAHGGEVTLQSLADGSGARASIRLPL